MNGLTKKTVLFTLWCLFLFAGTSVSQNKGSTGKGTVFVDNSGVMRWGHNNEEVKGFGVNYSAPFAHAYRTAQRLDVDLKKAIDNDVYHFARLGFDLYRIHVWDTEISDAEGNLLENENLEMFDYLLKQLKDRNINFMLTPIAYWGSGWPEPDPETPGFSHKYGKEDALTNPEAIKAQENYLAQFLEHVNPHTGVAYKDEPNIIGFEVSNEPHHKGPPEEVTGFIQRMVTAIRSTGTKKPVFYNVSHSTHLMEAYFNSDIQGGTFQWYPTGLGFQKELEGNLLPNVDEYSIPFDDVIRKNNGGKLVYEFDAADVMKSYIYPAMARSFREAGIQIATHFAYDPTYMAHANTEYNTHYMNLAYTPQKALALMISREVFHQVPMHRDYGSYPGNKQFGNFRVDYLTDLAELNSKDKFIYTNSTTTKPKSVRDLKQIAGFGNSAVVKYEGRGAYFLDRLQKGVWRLEVMPDAILTDNPFGKNNLEKTVAVINWNTWNMSLNIPDLGQDFNIIAINKGNTFIAEKTGNSFNIAPGTYLLTRQGTRSSFTGNETWNKFRINEFFAPEDTVERTYVIHEAVEEIAQNGSLRISAEIVSNEEVEKAEIWLQIGNRYENLKLQNLEGYTYFVEVPEEILQRGFLRYRIIVTTPGTTFTFPADVEGNPGQWDFYEQDFYETLVVSPHKPLYLFEAATDSDYLISPWRRENKLVPSNVAGEAEFQVRLEQLFIEDVENKTAAPVYDYSLRYNFLRNIKGRKPELPDFETLVVKARSLSGKTEKVQIALIDENGVAFGKIINILPEKEEYFINLTTLSPVKTVILPRPYPTFLPYYFEHENSGGLKMGKMEGLQISIGPGMDEEEKQSSHEIGIISFRLEK